METPGLVRNTSISPLKSHGFQRQPGDQVVFRLFPQSDQQNPGQLPKIILYICILSHIAISLPLVFSVFCAAY
jgi:hypothetical protein